MKAVKTRLFFALLLRAYPKAFRQRHRNDLLAFWQAQSAEPCYRGWWGRRRFTLHKVADAATGALRLRWRE